MAKKLDDKNTESIVVDLVQGVLDVNLLNLAKANQRAAFLQAIEERPALLSKVSKENEEHFFTLAISKKPEYFVHLKRKQYTNALAQIYLFDRLSHSADKKSSQSILVGKSLDDKVVFTMSYLSSEADQLYYLDRELQVPVSLRSNLLLTLKLEDAVALIDKLDTHITQLGEEKIKSVIADLVANQYKSYLNSYINDNKLGYYSLCTSLTAVEKGFAKHISHVFDPYGISVSDFVIKSIAIPKDIQNKIEDQAFQIRQRRADVEADSEFAKLSLESYEAKLAIHGKYPDAEVTLTEYEKDLALKRYLTKIGRNTEAAVDHTIAIDRKVLRADSTVDKAEDIIPEIPTKPNIFRRRFIVLSILAAILSFIIMSNNMGTGKIVFGLFILVFGLVAAFNTEKFATIKIEPSLPTDFDTVGGESTTSQTTEE